MRPELRQQIEAWLASDPDPETRDLTAAWLATEDERLEDCFAKRLSFGTAGLRGALGPGPNRMNRALVRRVTAGLAAWARTLPGDGPVVVGFDGRVGSRVFAEDTARVLAGAGLTAWCFSTICPTPVLAFAVRTLGARAGVMVTASHNPPGDNGYKVYTADAAQISAPIDQLISAAIDAVGDLSEVSLAPVSDVRIVPTNVVDDYIAQIRNLRVHPVGRSLLRIVYTPLHGVGAATVERVLRGAGHLDLHTVPEQREPDGAFPTVRFPNPEEPGALDLAFELATGLGADLVLANDPDADRIAVAVPGPGGWRALTGNEIGVLLAEDLLAYDEDPRSERLVATTIVSTPWLRRIAKANGATYVETLTGFKWIARAALAPDAGRFVLGFEEALGVCAGAVVRDKDGVSAALLMADLVRWLRDQGLTLLDALDELQHRDGVHLSAQVTVTLPGASGVARITAIMAALRSDPPSRLGGTEVIVVRDTSTGDALDRRTGARTALPSHLVKSDVLGFDLEGGDRVMVRPSGTEPKLKAYLDVVEPVGADGLPAAQERASQRLAALRDAVSALTAPE